MKKILALCISLFLCICCCSSCRPSYSKGEFFSDEFLSTVGLADMPIPPNLDKSMIQQGKALYLGLTNSEYEEYVTSLLEYLRSKEDIFHLGFSVGRYLDGEIFPYNVIAPLTDDYNCSEINHSLFFSVADGFRGRGGNRLTSPVHISIRYEYGELTYEGYEYNTVIAISDGLSAEAEWNICGAEHTYDDGKEYIIPGSRKTVVEYKCIFCEQKKLSDFIGDSKTYNITIEDTYASRYLRNVPDNSISGVIVSIRANKPSDADLKFIVNGTEIEAYEPYNGILFYEFIMPCSDVVITTEIISNDLLSQMD